MKLEYMTDEEVENEIARLRSSDAVKLAAREQRYKAGRRKTLYQLRWMNKHGEELLAQGYSLESSFLNDGNDSDEPC